MWRTYDVDNLIVLSVLVSLQVVLEALGVIRNLRTLSSVEVVGHAVVEGEERGRSTDFSTHVADSSHACAGEAVHTRTEILDDETRSALLSSAISF